MTDDMKNKVLRFRVTQEEYDRFMQVAKIKGHSNLSHYIRELINQEKLTVKFRPHRGLLADSMADMRVFGSIDEMFEFIAHDLSGYLTKEDLSVSDDLGKDQRIDWKETRYVLTKRFGSESFKIPQCIGMCSIE